MNMFDPVFSHLPNRYAWLFGEIIFFNICELVCLGVSVCVCMFKAYIKISRLQEYNIMYRREPLLECSILFLERTPWIGHNDLCLRCVT